MDCILGLVAVVPWYQYGLGQVAVSKKPRRKRLGQSSHTQPRRGMTSPVSSSISNRLPVSQPL
jgi:hypothetical protein